MGAARGSIEGLDTDIAAAGGGPEKPQRVAHVAPFLGGLSDRMHHGGHSGFLIGARRPRGGFPSDPRNAGKSLGARYSVAVP